jgi:hypothetical protein
MAASPEQISKCTPGNPASFVDSFHSPDEFKHLNGLAAMERQFSVARHVGTDFQMAKLPESLQFEY